jgi:hypothetical protein
LDSSGSGRDQWRALLITVMKAMIFRHVGRVLVPREGISSLELIMQLLSLESLKGKDIPVKGRGGPRIAGGRGSQITQTNG